MPLRRTALMLAGLLALGWSLFAQTAIDNNRGADFAPKPPIAAKTPADAAKTFVLPPGYRMELLVAEPDVISPAVIEFDGNGRMYVAEFRTYMPDVDGTNQHAAVNPISRWEDTNGDGTFDKKTIFADKLVLPRMILPLDGNSILTNETASDDVIKLTDTNNDGVADKREVVFSGVGIGRDGNLEHEQSGFVWGLDNWIYSTYNSFRFRWTPRGMLREPLPPNGGQWGLTQDDDGKMWFVCAGCERGPLNFHVPIQYGAFNRLDGEFEAGFDLVWPIAGLGDIQGGMGRVRMPVGTLNHFTATAGPDIVRGHRMPPDLVGDLLFTEPVGRLIRRTKIVKDQGLTQLQNAYPGSEFILSTDPLFRPVNMKTAPDGTVYVADMYHGIIQEAQWAGPNSYLRHKILQYQLDKIVNYGRIWRLRFDGVPEVPATPAGPAARATPAVPAQPALAPDTVRPRMLDETAAQLVTHLSHANGWWRDTAQRLLVLKQDKSVVPALETMARGSDNLLARFHALWTLEGLSALSPALLRQALADPNPRMRIQAIRASETLYKAGDRSFDADYRQAAKDKDADVALQAILTMNLLKVSDAAAVIAATMAENNARGIQTIGKILLTPPAAGRGGRGGAGLTSEQQDQMDRGQTIYGELCTTCHGPDGRGMPLSGAPPGTTMAPPLAGSATVQSHRDYVIRTILHGLTGPVNGKEYTQVMIPMGLQKDDWIAAIGSYVRNSFGNSASFITPTDVARVRTASGPRKLPWTVAEIEAALPVLLPAQPNWIVTASHNSGVAGRGLTTAFGWTSGAPPAAGMWFQIELSEPAMIAEIQFNAPAAGRGGGPGGGGPVPAGAGAAQPGAANPAAGRGAPPAGTPTTIPPATPPATLPTTPPATPPTTPPATTPQGQATPPAGPPAAPAPAVRDVQVQTSMDGKTWSAPLASTQNGGLTILAFPPVRAKFIRITRTQPAAGNNWTIQNLRVFRAAQPPATR